MVIILNRNQWMDESLVFGPLRTMRPLQNAPFYPISASGSSRLGGTRNIQYIPVVKIFAFLDLDQISADFEIEHFSKVSL